MKAVYLNCKPWSYSLSVSRLKCFKKHSSVNHGGNWYVSKNRDEPNAKHCMVSVRQAGSKDKESKTLTQNSTITDGADRVNLRRKQVQKTQQPNKVQKKRVLGTQAETPVTGGTLETQA